MTSLARIWRPFDLRRLTFRRKHGMFERSKDYDSRAMPPETTDDDSRCDSPCPPCPSSPPTPPPCPPPPTYHVPHSNPRKLAFWRMLSLCVAAPLIVIMSVVTYVRQREKMKEPREPYMDYPYMYRRTKVLVDPVCQNCREKRDLRNFFLRALSARFRERSLSREHGSECLVL
ncbi:uncharacterized protein LOC105838504 isoform X1 [Monomorium pharaonis]|uniref:uncharacterized protein LOC105838504 isoform X1 n=1 Tax=Monomorium pharaonis TaxID=307658 RepID=UPI001747A8C3|nr:uncharacterized protein LOC105838504 isoform X1 [Monomorium pharaonis]